MEISCALLGSSEPLEPWQRRCLEELQRIPGLRLVEAPSEAELSGLELDFVLTWKDPQTTLLARPRYGVWRFLFGDWTRFRGGPPGFWEVHEAQPVSTTLLVRLTKDPEAVIVLGEAHLRTRLLSSSANRGQLQQTCAPLLRQACTDLHHGNVARFSAPPRRAEARAHAGPTSIQLLQHRWRLLRRMLRKGIDDLFRHEQWNVGIVDQPIEAFLGRRPRAATHWLPQPRPEEIRADPFGSNRNGRLTVFLEHLSFKDNRGVILAIGLDPTQQSVAVPVHIGPERRVHLSYPFLIEMNDRTYCVPETHQAREVGLYEMEQFPDRWKKVATLLSDTVIVDATVFEFRGLWWLAGSEAAPKGANCELHLWYSKELAGPWQPHPANPVKIDVRSARPGGTPFIHEGQLYRPAQDCSRTYGSRIIINRVTDLTPTSFGEEFAAAVDPDVSGPYPEGLHTLSAVGAVTLIDGKRIRFVPAQFVRTVEYWLRMLFRKRVPDAGS